MSAKIKMRLSTIEKKILAVIQKDIPLTREPFKILAKRIGIDEKKLLGSIDELKKKGIIRNYAAGINHKRLGFKSTLLGLKVPPDRLECLAKELIAYPEVTHCFQRDGEYSLWVVFVYKGGLLKEVLNKLAREIGKGNVLNLTTKRQFKLRTAVRL